jgi:hypothetical protein
MIGDLQPGEVVVAEKIDRISHTAARGRTPGGVDPRAGRTPRCPWRG